MKTLLTSFILTLALLSVNAYAAQIRQIADGQYSGEYNGVKLNNVQAAFNSVTAKSNTGVELGAIIAVPSHAIGKYTKQNGWLPCDGVADTTGTELCKQNPGMCGKTPNLNGGKKILQGTDGESQMVDAGLPNIRGSLESPKGDKESLLGPEHAALITSGALSVTYGGRGMPATDSVGSGYPYPQSAINLNANDSSPIYRDDITTVQPETYTVRYYIRVNE